MNGASKSHFWIGLSLIWVTHFFMDFMLGVWPVFKTIAQIDLVVAGLIASLGIFIGEGLQLYFGYLSDKGYQQKLLALGIGLTATIPLLSYVQNEWILFLMIVCSYVGSGAFHPSGSCLLIGGNSSYKSSLIAFFACGGMVGAAMSQISYSQLYYRFNGGTWFLILPILLCLLGCLFFPFKKGKNETSKLTFKQLLQSIKPQKNQLMLLYIIHVFLQIVVLSFTFLLPDILKIKGHQEWFYLGGGYFCFIIGAALATIPIGYAVDKLGYRPILAIIVCLSSCLLYLFLALETASLVSSILILLFLGATLGVIIPVVVAGGIQDVPSSTYSFVSAIFMGGTTCIAGFGPILACLLASSCEKQPPVTALQGLSSLLILSFLLIYFLPQKGTIANQQVCHESSLT